MEQFKITLNQDQKEALKKAGYEGLTEDTDNILFYLYSLIDWLSSHNKNYNKEQYNRIDIANDVLKALYENF